MAVSGSFHFKAQFKSKFLCIVIRHFEMTNLFCDWSHVEFVGDFFFPCQKLLWYVFVNTLWINNLIDVSLWFSFGCLMFYSVCTVKLQMSDNVLFVFLLSAHVSNCFFEVTRHPFPVILPTLLYIYMLACTHSDTHRHFLWLQMWEPLKKRSLGHNTRPVGLCTR